MKRILSLVVVLFCGYGLFAQEVKLPIIKADVAKTQTMFEKAIWRRMNLDHVQNMPYNSKNSEMSRLLIEAVQAGLLQPYMTDSTNNPMSDDLFLEELSYKETDFNGQEISTPIRLTDFSIIYFKENVVFDKNRSRLYWYIKTVSLALPGGIIPGKGFETQIAHFKYDDVINVFRGRYADRAIWYNNQNQAQHRNFGDALELRLFNAPIIKVSNSENLDLVAIEPDPFRRVLLQRKMEHDIMEYESELWEY